MEIRIFAEFSGRLSRSRLRCAGYDFPDCDILRTEEPRSALLFKGDIYLPDCLVMFEEHGIMGNDALGSDLEGLIDRISVLLEGRKNLKLCCRTPLSYEDEQEQLKATFEITQVSRSFKESGDYWLATAHLTENVKYYHSTGDLGKCGYFLLEVADCLFSSGETEISTACCEEAIPLMIKGREQYGWARRMAAVGELLLAAITLNRDEARKALAAVRRARSRLTSKEVRILFNEDAHRVSRKLITAYKTQTREPLQELERTPPRRKRTEEKNLLALLDEWTSQYNAIRSSLEKLSSSKTKPRMGLPRDKGFGISNV